MGHATRFGPMTGDEAIDVTEVVVVEEVIFVL